MRTKKEVLQVFSTDKKLNEVQKATLLRIEMSFKDFTTEMLELAPDNSDRLFAVRQLLVAKDALTHSVTHHTEDKNEKNTK